MSDEPEDPDRGVEPRGDRRVRADAQRNLDALLQSAKAVFATSGVDAPVREIAEKAGRMVALLIDGLRCDDAKRSEAGLGRKRTRR